MMELNIKFIDLIKKNEHIIGFEDHSTQIYQRLPISARRYKEIEIFTTKKNSITNLDSYFDTYKKLVQYCLEDFPINDFDSIVWESTTELEEQKSIFGIKQIIEACLYRSVRGIAYFRQPSKIG